MTEISKEYFAMQDLGRETMDYVRSIVKPGMNLRQLRAECEEYMLSRVAYSFWL